MLVIVTLLVLHCSYELYDNIDYDKEKIMIIEMNDDLWL